MNSGLLVILLIFIVVTVAIYLLTRKKKHDAENEFISDSENQLVNSIFDNWQAQVVSNMSELIGCALNDDYNCDVLHADYFDDESTSIFFFFTKMLHDTLHNIRLIFNDFDKENLPDEWQEVIVQNKKDLAKERSNLIKRKKYGQVDGSEWVKEMEVFASEIIGTDEYVTTLTNKIIMAEQGLHDKLSVSDYKQPEPEYAEINDFFDSAIAQRARELYKTQWLHSNDYSDLVRDIVDIHVSVDVSMLIDSILDDETIDPESNADGKAQDISSISPYDYEEMCANILSEAGWIAKATKKSGDQGADVYAEKDSLSVVLQCKLTNTPVGNKAVQEAISGQKYMSADFSVVVTPAKYTPGAQDIAKAAKVLLLHHEDLPHLESLCKRLLS